jgi:hypothetical protein
VAWLISPSVDGDLAAMVVRRWGVVVVRGSATRTGVRAMRDLYRAIVRDRVAPVILPDGPSGPPGRCKPGPVMLASLSGAPLLPMACHAARAWRLPTWDRTLVPRPFTRVAIAVGAPRRIPRDLSAEALERERAAMEQTLDALDREAAAALARA